MSEYIELPLENGNYYRPTNGDINHYEAMFPNINVTQEFCMMQVWLESNPSRRKKNIKRFIANWLIRATNQQTTPSRVAADAAVGRNLRG